MSLSDPRYLLFLVAVVIGLPLLPAGRGRLAAVALVSLYFYTMFNPWYGPLLVTVAAFTFSAGWVLARLPAGLVRTGVFCAAVVTALVPLLLFKYLGVLSAFADPLRQTYLGYVTDLALPIGISFYTFQAVGYIIDCYVGNIEPEKDVVRFASFLCFFPILSAGPIERAGHLLPQLDRVGQFDYSKAVSGLRVILVGLFLKIVIADNLAPLVDGVYTHPSNHGALDLALATIYFSFQVYADFAGYSLIAIGSGRLLGIELLPNFAQPFLSQTLTEYWRTWHMTLSAWFRDYVFTPLQFQWRRNGRLGLAAALIITFTIVGIWHGAGTKYAVFGAFHGLLVSWSTLTFKARDRFWTRLGVPKPLLHVTRVVLTFSIVTLTFVLFRAANGKEAISIYRKIASGSPGGLTLPVLWPLLLIALLVLYDLSIKYNLLALLKASSRLRLAAYHAATATICVAFCMKWLAGASGGQPFIYFKF